MNNLQIKAIFKVERKGEKERAEEVKDWDN